MAEFVEEVEDKKEEPQQEEVKAEEVKEEIPEKYKEKTLQDVIAMHQEAEKLIGRQGTELENFAGLLILMFKVNRKQSKQKSKKLVMMIFLLTLNRL